MFLKKKCVCGNYVWILRWVNLHCNWINLLSVLSFLKQWIGEWGRRERIPDAYSENCQTSKMECLTKTVNSFYPLTISAKHFILDIWQGSAYVPGLLKLLCSGSKGVYGKVDVRHTDYSIHSKLRIFPYSKVIHESTTFKLTKN